MKKNRILVIVIAIILVISVVGGVISWQSKSVNGVQSPYLAQTDSSWEQNPEDTAGEKVISEVDNQEEENEQITKSTEPNIVQVVIPNEEGEDIIVEFGAISSDKSNIPEDSSHSNEYPNTAPSENSGEKDHDTQQPDSTFEPQVPTQPNGTPGPDLTTTYAEYEAMSPEAQMLFYYSFADADDFHSWYNAAKAEYEAGRGDIVVGDGDINMEEIFKDNER